MLAGLLCSKDRCCEAQPCLINLAAACVPWISDHSTFFCRAPLSVQAPTYNECFDSSKRQQLGLHHSKARIFGCNNSPLVWMRGCCSKIVKNQIKWKLLKCEGREALTQRLKANAYVHMLQDRIAEYIILKIMTNCCLFNTNTVKLSNIWNIHWKTADLVLIPFVAHINNNRFYHIVKVLNK